MQFTNTAALACALFSSVSLPAHQMAVATPYNDLQPVRKMDDAEALRISQKIDEELKVDTSFYHTKSPSADAWLHRPKGSSYGRGRTRDEM